MFLKIGINQEITYLTTVFIYSISDFRFIIVNSLSLYGWTLWMYSEIRFNLIFAKTWNVSHGLL